jgi:hypothetical protein
MRVNRKIFYGLVLLFILQALALPSASAKSLLENNSAAFSAISFVPNIETAGIAVSGTGLPVTAELYYRLSGDSTWHGGHPLVLVPDGRLIGSLFNLSAGTSYDVRVAAGAMEITGSVTTQADQLSFTPSNVLHVNDDAVPGGNGSAAAPYQTIQEAVNHAGPGTQVLVADGTYREAVTFPGSGAAGNWIQVKAEGNAAVLDGADRLSGNIWTLTSTSKVWYTKIAGPVAYLARSGTRFYQYDDLNGLKQGKGHGGVAIKEGWFYETATSRLYIRSLDTPSAHLWQVPRLNHAFDIGARDWLWIEGFEIRFYGTTTNGCGVCSLNASHLVVRRNKIHNMQLGIFVNWNGTDTQGNDSRIEANEVYDPGIYDWPWASLKASYMEGTGIIVRGHVGAIVRDNTVHSYFNGIYTGSSGALENPDLAFDADIYRNYMYNVSDDGLEPEGACINQRFRNNIVDKSFIGISVAPVTQGPTWILRNRFTGFTGRAIKFADDSDGIVLIYQNTSWTTVSNINGVDLITAIHNVRMRNNIFQSAGYSINEVPTGSTGNDWNTDNWYTSRGTGGPHFKWENINYNTVATLCASTGLECNGYENPPGFANPAGNDFTLLSTSPNIDRGAAIPGINDDYAGSAPDVGAYEFGSKPATTFVDVPTTYPYYQDIETLYANGLTGGCHASPPKFCPDQIMDRAQAAVFMVRGSLGVGFVPGPAQHFLSDNWAPGGWAEPWAEAIISKGLSAGCSLNPRKYCPWDQLPREQVVVFGLRMKYGVNYQPPPATGTLFADMTNTSYFATAWAEQAYQEGLMPACGTSEGKPLFCPKDLVTRGLGAYVIVRAKSLSMP